VPDSDLMTHTLDVPGARLYYERRGDGPPPLMIGSPMDSAGFAGLASALATAAPSSPREDHEPDSRETQARALSVVL
jgi:hypothetical protein